MNTFPSHKQIAVFKCASIGFAIAVLFNCALARAGEEWDTPIYRQAREFQRTRDECAKNFYGDGSGGGGSWNFSNGGGGGSKKPVRFGLLLGARYIAHYNRQRVLSTPPEAFVAEAQLLIWYKQIQFYLTFGDGVAISQSMYIGGGAKLPFLTFEGSGKGLIGGISFQLVVDFVHFTVPDPTPPDDYPASGFVLRYGASLSLGISSSKLFFDMTMMLMTFNNNFFIAPVVGLGYQF